MATAVSDTDRPPAPAPAPLAFFLFPTCPGQRRARRPHSVRACSSSGPHAERVRIFLLPLDKYICYAEQTRAVLAKLADHGKKMFLITNSPSSFV